MTTHLPNGYQIDNVRRLHASDYSRSDLDLAIERAIVDEHRWEPTKPGDRRVHDWRGCVGSAIAREWPNMTFSSRVAVALDAESLAGAQEWE